MSNVKVTGNENVQIVFRPCLCKKENRSTSNEDQRSAAHFAHIDGRTHFIQRKCFVFFDNLQSVIRGERAPCIVAATWLCTHLFFSFNFLVVWAGSLLPV